MMLELVRQCSRTKVEQESRTVPHTSTAAAVATASAMQTSTTAAAAAAAAAAVLPTHGTGTMGLEPETNALQRCEESGTTVILASTARLPYLTSQTRDMYNEEDIKRCCDRVTKVSYKQTISLAHVAAAPIEITPISSSFSIGSCNWVIVNGTHKIVCVSAASSALRRHPQPLNVARMKDCSILILADVSSPPLFSDAARAALERAKFAYANATRDAPLAIYHLPQTNADRMLGKLSSLVCDTVRAGGRVLLPCFPTGIVYDIFEHLYWHLHKQLGRKKSPPCYFISPVADLSLGYASITGEWLCNWKLEQVYEGKYPFGHEELIRNGQVLPFQTVNDATFKKVFDPHRPSIVICGHPSLCFGECSFFLDKWHENEANALVLVEPRFPSSVVCRSPAFLKRASRFKMRIFDCPIDPRLSFSEIPQLIESVGPNQLFVPSAYVHASDPIASHVRASPELAQTGHGIKVSTLGKPVTLWSEGDVVHVPQPNNFASAVLDAELVQGITLKNVSRAASNGKKSGSQPAALVTAVVDQNDAHVTLSAVPEQLRDAIVPKGLSADSKFQALVKFDPKDILVQLKKRGVRDARIEPLLSASTSSSGGVEAKKAQRLARARTRRDTNAFAEHKAQHPEFYDGSCVSIPSLNASIEVRSDGITAVVDDDATRKMIFDVLSSFTPLMRPLPNTASTVSNTVIQ
jgi:Cft2 family RNA processing exonuclease